jgi:peptidoglycan/LPS O-acetylase OafA/YrhL
MASPTAKLPLRRDIEGLRAVAVLAVAINHVMPSALRGGFCGVDVFFVISGYLIGMHLLEDIQAGRFSFLRFYARRARRLLPALVVVLLAVWGCAWVILTGPEFAALGKHVAAATVFANNFLLSAQNDYFDAPSTAKPLLHLWSLGVEEQFYLLVPFLLWLGARGRQGSIRWVVWLSVLSLFITVCRPVPSFYLLDTRFWELGVGVAIGYVDLRRSEPASTHKRLGGMDHREIVAGALALMFAATLAYVAKAQPWSQGAIWATSGISLVFVLATGTTQLAGACQRPRSWERLAAAARRHGYLLREASGVTGFVAIGLTLFAMTSADWPGPQTVLPVLGTALVIAAGPTARANRFLSLGFLVFLGGISYPLYLWHWPIIVFFRMLDYGDSTAWAFTAIVAAVALAWCTRELVEAPARFGRLWTVSIVVPPTWVLACGLMFTGLLGVAAVATDGFPSRYSPRLRALASPPRPGMGLPYRLNSCSFQAGTNGPLTSDCVPHRRPGIPAVLLWGDSHAAHLYPGVLDLQSKHDFDLIQWTAAGCPPTRTHWASEFGGCQELRDWVLRHMERVVPDTVLLAAHWDLYLSRGATQDVMLSAIVDDVVWLQHLGVRNIVLFGPGPTWNSSLGTALVRYMRLRHSEQIPDRLGGAPRAVWRLDAAMAAEARTTHARYVSVVNAFCNPDGCRTVVDAQTEAPELLFLDGDHLSASGSRFLLDAAMPVILATARQ